MDAGTKVKFILDNKLYVEGVVVRDSDDCYVFSNLATSNDEIGKQEFLFVEHSQVSNLKILNNDFSPFLNKTSRTKYLEKCLVNINDTNAIKALKLVMGVMNARNGYKRHNGTDYFLHLVDVTQILYNYGIRDSVTLTAALLHDLAEDCYELGYTLEYISKEFGPEVSFVVDKVTKKPFINYKIRENMEEYLRDIFTDVRCCLIKVADRIHNFGTLGDATREKILRQSNETKDLFIPFFKKCRNQYGEYAAFFFAAKTMVEPHILEIQAHQYEIEAHKNTISKHEVKIKELEKQLLMMKMSKLR